MRLLAVTSIAILASMAAAWPAASVARRADLAENPPFQITNLSIGSTKDGKTSLSYTVTNPEPLANGATAECSTSWNTAEKNWPRNDKDVKCGNSLFDFHIESFNSEKDFVVGLQHRFNDPDVGKPPYDRVTVFARMTINDTVVAYQDADGEVTGKQIEGRQISAPVYATIA